jgi:hypothetical protein
VVRRRLQGNCSTVGKAGIHQLQASFRGQDSWLVHDFDTLMTMERSALARQSKWFIFLFLRNNWLYELRLRLRGNEGLLAPPQLLQPPRPRALTEVS